MIKQTLFIVLIFLLSACASDMNWQRTSGGGETVLNANDRECRTVASQEVDVLKTGSHPGEHYGIARGEKLQKHAAVYEGCMVKKGWVKAESS
jgi:hypothetical protein